MDRLFEEAAVALDEAKRQELYSKVQQILVEEVPVAWTLELEYPIIYDKAYKNIVTIRDRLTRDLRLGLQIVTGTRSAARIALLIVTWVTRLVAVILVIATFNFVLVRAAPGDPAMVMAGQSGGADPEDP